MNDDWKNTNEFGDIQLVKGTKYWFKRDLQTIKTAFKRTLQYSPILLLPSIVLSISLSYSYFNNLLFGEIVGYIVIFYPITLLAYFLIYVMVKKGYDIDPYSGTSIDTSRNPRPKEIDDK